MKVSVGNRISSRICGSTGDIDGQGDVVKSVKVHDQILQIFEHRIALQDRLTTQFAKWHLVDIVFEFCESVFKEIDIEDEPHQSSNCRRQTGLNSVFIWSRGCAVRVTAVTWNGQVFLITDFDERVFLRLRWLTSLIPGMSSLVFEL